MNDGSALVLFSLSRSIVLSHHVPSTVDTFAYIIRLSVGGPILGITVGAIASYVSLYLVWIWCTPLCAAKRKKG